MRIITISREFGSGGREVGKRLADLLGYDYYDSEIITAIAKKSGLDENYIEKILRDHGWQNQTITFRGTLGSSAYAQSSKVTLLVEQKKVIEEIAALGKDCVIVGRNADVILEKYQPFSMFVYAKTGAKIKRCMERTKAEEQFTQRELIKKMKQIDKMRSQTREVVSGSSWGQPDAYQLMVNTTDWEIKDLVPTLADFIEGWYSQKEK